MKLIKYEQPRLPSVFDMDRWLEDVWGGFPRWPGVEDWFEPGFRSLQPAADLYEDNDNYHVRLEFPGFKKNELKVDLAREILTVAAEHEAGEETTALSRSITVPEGILPEKVTAHYEDGILTVTLPKPEQHKPKAIEIK